MTFDPSLADEVMFSKVLREMPTDMIHELDAIVHAELTNRDC